MVLSRLGHKQAPLMLEVEQARAFAAQGEELAQPQLGPMMQPFQRRPQVWVRVRLSVPVPMLTPMPVLEVAAWYQYVLLARLALLQTLAPRQLTMMTMQTLSRRQSPLMLTQLRWIQRYQRQKQTRLHPRYWRQQNL